MAESRSGSTTDDFETIDKIAVKIENKLEEMFAGIEETMPPTKSSPGGAKKSSPAAKQQAASEPATDSLTELAGKTESESSAGSNNSMAVEAEPGPSGTQKKVLTPAAKRASAGKAAGAPLNERKKVLKKKSAHGKGTTLAAAEEKMANLGAGKVGGGIQQGPKCRVKLNEADLNGKYKGPFLQVISDGSHMVINAPINENDSDKPQNKTKWFTNSSEQLGKELNPRFAR